MKAGKVKKNSNTTGVPISKRVDDNLVATSAKDEKLLKEEYHQPNDEDEKNYQAHYEENEEEMARVEDLDSTRTTTYIKGR